MDDELKKGVVKLIYLDNSATTRVDEEVLASMNNYHRTQYGNPSSLHRMGMVAEQAIDKARSSLAAMLGVEDKTIFFLSGGTEGNNLAITSAINKNKRIGNKLITSKIEHPSVLEVFKYFETCGYEVCYLDVDCKGIVDTQQLEREMTTATILVSIMKVNNEVGTIQDMKSISDIVKNKAPNCIVHSDCVQAFGKVPVHPLIEGIDILTFSGHKFHGPKGIGGIYIDKKCVLKPMIYGGGQEKGLRSGTENVPAIVGMGMAAQLLVDDFTKITEHINNLKGVTIDFMSREIEGIHFNSMINDDFAPHILNISIEDVKSEIVLHLLEKDDIFISSGSACSSNKRSTSHVLKSMNLSSKIINGSLRISFSKYNTIEEIEYMVKVLKEAVANLRKYTRR